MKNKILISLLIVAFLNFVGCYSLESISKEEFISKPNDEEVEVYTNTRYVYSFDPKFYEVREDSLFGLGEMDFNGTIEQFKGNIALDDIIKIKRDSFNWLRTGLLIGGITAVLITIAVIVGAYYLAILPVFVILI